MAKAIALIVAGSGETSPDEVTDLLNDAYDDYDVDIVVPVSKAHYTKSVKNVVDWLNDDGLVLPVLAGDGPLARGLSSRFEDPVEFDSLEEVFDPTEFEDRDEVHFLLAVPDGDDEDFDFYVGLAEAAEDAGIPIKNLCNALDDVILTDEDEPEEPAEAPKKDPVDEETAEAAEEPEEAADVPEDPPGDSAVEQAEYARAALATDPRGDHLLVTTRNLIEALQDFENALKPQPEPTPDLSSNEDTKPVSSNEDKPATRRGRGRPRTNFEQKQIWDEDEGEWVKRPKGRVKKGTKYRTLNTETEEVTEEGVV